MFEGVIASLLNQYLGQFIEGLDSKQLNLSVWSGAVDMKNLQIKPSCLDFLHLPIIVKGGSVGRLLLKCNWARLSSEPVRIVLEDMLVSSTCQTYALYFSIE